MVLNVVIVGGGIAGLTAAISLRRARHNVCVYERSSMNSEVGAAIHVPPNASRALLAWGLDPVHAKFVTAKSGFRANAKTLEKFYVGTTEYDATARYGAPWYLAHRVDLHEELKRLATDPDGQGPPATVYLKSKVVKYNTDEPSIVLENGDIIKADVVIAADGLHSIGVEAVLGRTNPPEPSKNLYNFCYRFLIPSADLVEDPSIPIYTQEDDGCMKIFTGHLKRLVSYPCRNNEVHNFLALFHEDNVDLITKEDWCAFVDKSKLLEKYADVHPSLFSAICKATNVRQWPLLFRPPIPCWTKGNLALAGDAAHPMLTHQGQGSAQGIEDGVVLGMVLIDAKKENVAERLKLYEKIRRNRASIMQIFSNAGQDEPELIKRDAAEFMPASNVPTCPNEFFDFNFGYDVVQDATSHIKEFNSLFTLPDGFFQREPGKMP